MTDLYGNSLVRAYSKCQISFLREPKKIGGTSGKPNNDVSLCFTKKIKGQSLSAPVDTETSRSLCRRPCNL